MIVAFHRVCRQLGKSNLPSFDCSLDPLHALWELKTPHGLADRHVRIVILEFKSNGMWRPLNRIQNKYEKHQIDYKYGANCFEWNTSIEQLVQQDEKKCRFQLGKLKYTPYNYFYARQALIILMSLYLKHDEILVHLHVFTRLFKCKEGHCRIFRSVHLLTSCSSLSTTFPDFLAQPLCNFFSIHAARIGKVGCAWMVRWCGTGGERHQSCDPALAHRLWLRLSMSKSVISNGLKHIGTNTVQSPVEKVRPLRRQV